MPIHESVFDAKPWLALYNPDVLPHVSIEHRTALDMFTASVNRDPARPLIHYFDATATFGQVDEWSDALAVALAEREVRRGDRIAFVMQNVPQFIIATIAVWKLGGTVVPLNPMYREREIRTVLEDSGAIMVICLESMAGTVAEAAGGTSVRTIITTSELDLQTRNDERIFSSTVRLRTPEFDDLLDLIDAHSGQAPPAITLDPQDVAYLPYTSGTTGPPKGSMSTHANVVFTSQMFRDWLMFRPDSVALGVAPLFHITGLICNVSTPLLVGAPVVLTCRFDPIVSAEAIAEHQVTQVTGAITLFIAWTHESQVTRETLSSLNSIYSGGAPVPRAAVEAFREKFGHYIHNGYGLTETNAPAIAVPHGREAPVDPDSGAVSIGLPVPNSSVWIVDENDLPVQAGELGEVVVQGPQISAGYWNKPDETAHAMPGGRFHTGDIGVMDEQGWFYLIDRKKDQINASGFKVWPREVEDVLYEHPAVREVAVVGVPDSYRGETVKAFVSLVENAEVTSEELIEFAKGRMAAYKYPRIIEFMSDLPKTVSGKILRRELRDRP